MAPEVLSNISYQPQVADWFAFGVMLFMMYTGSAPFNRADFSDPFFYCIARGDLDKFWRAHMKHKPAGYFSEEFKDLISNLLAYQPYQRLSATEIVFHPFFASQDGVATAQQVKNEMRRRSSN